MRQTKKLPIIGPFTSWWKESSRSSTLSAATIRGLFETWRVVWGLFGIDVHNARVRAGSAGPDKWDRELLETHRSEARESAKLLIAQAATELRGQANSIECPSDE